jgi:signal transduction histidine kinase
VARDIAFVPSSRIFKTASFRLSALYGGVFALGFGALLLVTYWTATTALRDQIRTEVQSDLHALTTEAKADGIGTIVQEIKERIIPIGGSTDYFFLVDGSGKKLAGNLENVAMRDGWQETALNSPSLAKSDAPADEDHQLWGQGIHLPDGSFLFAGQDAFRALSAQESIINFFLWSAGISFLFAALAGIAISQGFLHRIDAINTTSLAIIDGNLRQRIPVRGTSDEIDRLSMNLNRLFDSNHALLESLKQVSTSIAHDLRAPLTRLRQGLEEARLENNDPATYQAAIEAAVTESDQLLATFTALLRIAQIEAGTRRAGFKPVDLTAIFDQVVDAYKAVAEDQGKALTLSIARNIKSFGDRDLLMQMLVNLLENALHHTGPGTKIELSLQNTESGPCAVVSDNGPGIPVDERQKIFERFYRLDASRSTPGSGLGLALVSAVAALHDIKITLDDNKPGLKITLDFSRTKAG